MCARPRARGRARARCLAPYAEVSVLNVRRARAAASPVRPRLFINCTRGVTRLQSNKYAELANINVRDVRNIYYVYRVAGACIDSKIF